MVHLHPGLFTSNENPETGVYCSLSFSQHWDSLPPGTAPSKTDLTILIFSLIWLNILKYKSKNYNFQLKAEDSFSRIQRNKKISLNYYLRMFFGFDLDTLILVFLLVVLEFWDEVFSFLLQYLFLLVVVFSPKLIKHFHAAKGKVLKMVWLV